MAEADTLQRITTLEVEVAHLQKTVDEMRTDVRAIRDILSQASGGWKTLAMVAGASAALGALMAKLIPLVALFRG